MSNTSTLPPPDHLPSQNHLLASFSMAVYERLLPHLKCVRLRKNETLSGDGKYSGFVFFPVDCVIAISQKTADGAYTEISMIGNEGMYDVAHVLNGMALPFLAEIQTTGHAFRMENHLFMQELANDESVQHTLLLYAQAFFTQIAQSAVCNKHHSLKQQLCLFLLLLSDKSLSNDLLLTQEAIAHMMGARRESITEAAGKLRNEGVIDYKRGHIIVMNRAGLEQQCCECYEVVKKDFKRLLGY